MRQASVTPGVLLGGSLLLNAVLLARKPEVPPASQAPPSSTPVKAVAPGAELVLERERVRALEARIKVLEEERVVLAQASTAPVPAADPLAGFREKLRKLVRFTKDPKSAASMTAEQQLEMAEVYMQLYRLQVGRSKDPKAYVEALKTAYGIILEETGSPLTPGQVQELSRVFDEYSEGLRELAGTPALDRFLKELEQEGATTEASMRLLTPAQQEQARTQVLTWMNGSMGVQWMSRNGAEVGLAGAWTQAYGLGDSQKPAVQLAAQAYLEGLDRLHAQYKGREHLMYDTEADGRAYRLASARLLADALRGLEGSMTAEQREKLRTQTPQEVRIMPEQVSTATPAVEKK